jgi:hypothetical protein
VKEAKKEGREENSNGGLVSAVRIGVGAARDEKGRERERAVAIDR